jgi:hypothetical protein
MTLQAAPLLPRMQVESLLDPFTLQALHASCFSQRHKATPLLETDSNVQILTESDQGPALPKAEKWPHGQTTETMLQLPKSPNLPSAGHIQSKTCGAIDRVEADVRGRKRHDEGPNDPWNVFVEIAWCCLQALEAHAHTTSNKHGRHEHEWPKNCWAVRILRGVNHVADCHQEHAANVDEGDDTDMFSDKLVDLAKVELDG